ncbi:MAG: DUF5667 domain-containing protein [Chloroflexi bacterium]|nr:DUF5667 domain-containing protein [Chloroflexota bacterium]
MSDNFEVILSECLDRIIKGDNIKQCLNDYPQHAAQLEPLLRVALSTKQISTIKPRARFKAEAKYRILTKLEKQTKKPEFKKEPVFSRMPRWATVLIVALFIVLVAGTGTVAAASNSLPGNILYPVKIASENVQTAFSFSDTNRVKQEMKLAGRRAEEISRREENSDSTRIELARKRFEMHMARIQILTNRIKAAQPANNTLLKQLEDQVESNAERDIDLLQKVEDKATGQLKSAVAKAKNNLSQAYDELIKEIQKGQNRNNGSGNSK